MKEEKKRAPSFSAIVLTGFRNSNKWEMHGLDRVTATRNGFGCLENNTLESKERERKREKIEKEKATTTSHKNGGDHQRHWCRWRVVFSLVWSTKQQQQTGIAHTYTYAMQATGWHFYERKWWLYCVLFLGVKRGKTTIDLFHHPDAPALSVPRYFS